MLEKGNTQPTAATAKAIADALGVTFAEIAVPEDDKAQVS
jgi:transcriptional regulator with XRE-family HTH domain